MNSIQSLYKIAVQRYPHQSSYVLTHINLLIQDISRINGFKNFATVRSLTLHYYMEKIELNIQKAVEKSDLETENFGSE